MMLRNSARLTPPHTHTWSPTHTPSASTLSLIGHKVFFHLFNLLELGMGQAVSKMIGGGIVQHSLLELDI